MKRRTCLQALLAAGASVAGGMAGSPGHPVELHLDMAVDPAKEKELLHNFTTIFRPEAAKHPGYVDVRLLKLRSVLKGSFPASVNYRFSLTYQSEELRQKWIATAAHQRVWPTLENTLVNKDYTVLLFDVV